MKQLNLMSMVEKSETNKTIKAREVVLPSLIFFFYLAINEPLHLSSCSISSSES
jgi:hypothetical protein